MDIQEFLAEAVKRGDMSQNAAFGVLIAILYTQHQADDPVFMDRFGTFGRKCVLDLEMDEMND